MHWGMYLACLSHLLLLAYGAHLNVAGPCHVSDTRPLVVFGMQLATGCLEPPMADRHAQLSGTICCWRL